ncbi:CobW family GTP-binding protein [Streptomyces sp. NPDC048290]|uniref:CobW family GTP-binding protein n=1 Tax=Streptomyces sp. NPDC048290 TaxID=3155811 RepID=UPI0034179D36
MGHSPSPRQIPVVILAGFLGSGKTTLLNHLLHHSGGSRIGAIVNDFGAIEIDAMAVAGALGDSTVSLGNGCLCCAVDASELDLYLERLAAPSAGIDVIVIEASGLAEPQELVRMVLASEHPEIVYGGLVEVVDAAEFDATRAKHPEIDRHLALADLVVVNKLDRAAEPPSGAARLLALVRSLTDRAAVVPARCGRIDPELLFDCRPSEERIGQLSFDDLHRHDPHHHDPHHHDPRQGDALGDGPLQHGLDHQDPASAPDGQSRAHVPLSHAAHLHAAYDTCSFVSDTPMDPRRLMAFLDSRPEGLYRIKGYVDFGPYDPRNRYSVHAVGRFLRFRPEPWAVQEPRRTQLVLIGSGIDSDALGKELAASTSDAPHADEHGMWGVLRYVRDPSTEEAGSSLPEGDLPALQADAPGTARS